MTARSHRILATIGLLCLAVVGPRMAAADHTAPPVTVNIPGSFQSEAGCPGDWQPDCPATHLSYDVVSDRWKLSLPVPAGSYEFKIAINDAWDENYGAGGVPNGANMTLVLSQPADVLFTYNPHTHVTTTSAAVIAVAAGSFQSEVGCPGDWAPDCALSQLTDPDANQDYTFATSVLPPGDYEFKVAIGFNWSENYGANGEPNGANIPFTVPASGALVTFHFDVPTHMPSVTVQAPTASRTASWGRLKMIYR